MKNKIFIISKSEIIRTGVASIIRKYFNIEIIEIAKVELLPDTQVLVYDGATILFDDEVIIPNDILKKLTSNQANTILIITNKAKKDISDYKYHISIYDTAENIRDLLSTIFNKTDGFELEKDSINLSTREIEVLELVALGNSNKEIADKLFISTHTVISHRKNITEKLGIKSISGLTVYAILNKIIDTENINPESLI